MWKRVRVSAKDCPRISQAFLGEQLKLLGPTRFSEEYELAFVDPLESAFSTDLIQKLFDYDLRPLWA
jgi:hypothetical protein